jgi:hypothetical protein
MQDGARDESIKDLAEIGSRKEGKSLYHVRIQGKLNRDSPLAQAR